MRARTRSDNPRGAISAFLVEEGTPGLEIGEATEMLAGNGSGLTEGNYGVYAKEENDGSENAVLGLR